MTSFDIQAVPLPFSQKFNLEIEKLEVDELLLITYVPVLLVAEVHVCMYIRVTTNYIAFGYITSNLLFYVLYYMPHDGLTLSLALIQVSAPLFSRATTVAVWPFIDER